MTVSAGMPWYGIAAMGLGLALAPLAASALFGFYLAYKLYHPYRRSGRKPDLAGLEAERLDIPSGRGIRLSGIYLKASGSEDLVLIAHEIGSFKESKLRLGRRLVEAGHNVLLFDMRNHGDSSKDRSWWPMSERFTDDIESALRFAGERYPGVKRTALLSFSFSTFPSLYIVRREVRQPDSIILDSGPSARVDELYGKFLNDIGRPMVPAALRLPLLFAIVKSSFQYFGLKMLATTWPPDFSRVESRVLFMANGKDPVFPEEEIRLVSGQIRRHQVWVCAEAGHLQAYKTEPEAYVETLLAFLKGSGLPPAKPGEALK